MEAATKKRTIAQDLVWANHMLDYTDQVCEGLTEENFNLRPTDPAGGYFFSVGEQAMHIVDSRWGMLSWMDGNDYSDREYSGAYPGKDKPWLFKEASTQEVIASLKEAREKINEIMAGDSAGLIETTVGTVSSYEESLKKAKDAGKDTKELEAEGPATLCNVLLFLCAHEQAHRGVLQTTLRMNGVDVSRVA